MFASISQTSLHEFKLQFTDRLTAKASLFPLFDDTGRTRALMLTSEEDGQILVLDHAAAAFAGRSLLPKAWPQRIALQRVDLEDSHREDIWRVENLWHYDPWWELEAARYTNHPLVPALKATNVCGVDPTISGVWFSRTLSRVTWVAFGRGETRKVKRFEPKFLHDAKRERERQGVPEWNEIPSRVGRRNSAEWRLRPFWEV